MCCLALLGLTMDELLVVLAGETPRESERHAGQRLEAYENILSETASLDRERQEYPTHPCSRIKKTKFDTSVNEYVALTPNVHAGLAAVPGCVKLATEYVTSATASVLIVLAAHSSVIQVVEMIQDQNVASKKVALDAVAALVVKCIAPAIDVHAAPASVAERGMPAPVVDLIAPTLFTMAIPRSCVTSRNKHKTFKDWHTRVWHGQHSSRR